MSNNGNIFCVASDDVVAANIINGLFQRAYQACQVLPVDIPQFVELQLSRVLHCQTSRYALISFFITSPSLTIIILCDALNLILVR